MIALLNSAPSPIFMSDLYSFTLSGSANVLGLPNIPGQTYRYSGAATAITDQMTGRVFGLGPRFERSTTKVIVGIQSDELDVRIYPAATDMVGSASWLAAVWQGQFDGATVQLERAFMQSWGNTAAGTVVLFAGRISDIEASRTLISLKVRSHLDLLNIQMPRRLWQASCTHNFGDPMCGYNRVAGTNAQGTATGHGALTFAAQSGSTTTTLYGVPNTTTPFALGTCIGTSGANAGQARTIAAYGNGVDLSVKLAFLSTPAVGDTFQILPGCDRTLNTCGNVFQNSRVISGGYQPANAETFGGMPFIPVAESSI